MKNKNLFNARFVFMGAEAPGENSEKDNQSPNLDLTIPGTSERDKQMAEFLAAKDQIDSKKANEKSGDIAKPLSDKEREEIRQDILERAQNIDAYLNSREGKALPPKIRRKLINEREEKMHIWRVTKDSDAMTDYDLDKLLGLE